MTENYKTTVITLQQNENSSKPGKEVQHKNKCKQEFLTFHWNNFSIGQL